VGARLEVRVQPGARVAEVGTRDAAGVWKLKVRAPAIEGRANEAARELIAERLGVPKGRVRIARGATSRRKTVEVDGLTQSQAEARMTRAEE
jgi:uncharacterized protein